MSADSMISRIMSFIHLSHSAKAFNRCFWDGDFAIAASCHLLIPSVPTGRVISFIWKKPAPQWIKINSNGAFSHTTQQATAGGGLRD